MFLFIRLSLLSVALLLANKLYAQPLALPKPIKEIKYTVVNTMPHDVSLYTQGLQFYDGHLYESAGLYGKSKLLKYKRSMMGVRYQRKLSPRYFAEGISMVGDKIYLLTWQSQRLFLYNAQDLSAAKVADSSSDYLSYSGQGWGLAYDGKHLIRSDGSQWLSKHDPVTFELLDTLAVTLNGEPLTRLNELEWVARPEGKHLLLANRWQDHRIYQINPDNGEVVASINLQKLVEAQPSSAEVLNGIAWNKATKTLWVTGKRWPTLYELKLNNID